ncbi:MAG: translation initiation factor IF-3 [Chloroflexi bacterium]|nr:translation initiation factor IF-3 [Chloroflexota bacterium]
MKELSSVDLRFIVDAMRAQCYTAHVKGINIPRKVSAISDEYRVNEQIRAREVRLINHENDNVGIVTLREAMDLANEHDLDLVEVAPNANPPVVRVMDYGKFLYEKKKRERAASKQQKQIEVKEIRLRPKTDPHHLGFKVRDAKSWLQKGMKVRVRVRFRGREIQYPEIAREMLDEIARQVEDVGVVEAPPKMDGRTMLMVLAPDTEKKKK